MSTDPALTLSFDPPGPHFSITEDCVMPKVTVTAHFQNITPDPGAAFDFQWHVSLVFTGKNCPHSCDRVIKHADIIEVTPSNQLTIPFTQVRGGDLTVNVSVKIGELTLTAQSQGLQITGTNPSVAALKAFVPDNDAFKKLMRLESGLRQFLSPAQPLFSADNLGGVGICQITQPAPTDDQVWSWKANVTAGLQFYHQKETAARSYPSRIRTGSDFVALVNTFNQQRQASHPGSPKLAIDLPEFTPEQLQRDTIRAYNGYCAGLHEYRVKVDANGVLVVSEDPSGLKGTAAWEQISAADRIAHYNAVGIAPNHRGDPNYVVDVESKESF